MTGVQKKIEKIKKIKEQINEATETMNDVNTDKEKCYKLAQIVQALDKQLELMKLELHEYKEKNNMADQLLNQVEKDMVELRRKNQFFIKQQDESIKGNTGLMDLYKKINKEPSKEQIDKIKHKNRQYFDEWVNRLGLSAEEKKTSK